jgi:hypothetical protein
MEPARYLETLDADADRLVSAAARVLSDPVPPCPGWTVEDVVVHTARVYLHKVQILRAGAPP